jgi:hypothetical protein
MHDYKCHNKRQIVKKCYWLAMVVSRMGSITTNNFNGLYLVLDIFLK